MSETKGMNAGEQQTAREQMAQNAALLRIATRCAHIGTWSVDLADGWVHWSDEVCALHEMPMGTRLSRKERFDCYAPDDRPTITAAFAACAENGLPFDLELQIVTARQRHVWVRTLGEPVRDADDKIIRVQGAFQDLTARHQAEESLRRYELENQQLVQELAVEKSRLIVAQTMAGTAGRLGKIGAWTIDLPGYDLTWSDEVCFIHELPPGHKPTFAEGTGYFLPEHRAEVERLVKQCTEHGTPYSFEVPKLTARGRRIWVRSTGEAVRGPNGQIIRLQGAFQDISERKAAEDLARREIAQQASLIDKAQDAIFVRDLEHRINFWSRGAERLYGWTSAEAVGQKLDALLKIDAPSFAEADRLVHEKGDWSGEIRSTAKDRTSLIVDGRWTLLRDETGRPQSILTLDTDVTERKKLESQVLRAQRMESIGTLAGGIAHDLNNLLSPIVLGVGLIELLDPAEEVKAIVKNIESAAKRGAELVKQVLSFARGVEGVRLPIQLGHIVREIESIVTNTFPKNITFERVIAKDLWLVVGDPTQLNQVLLNLCVNARDAMPGGGRLVISIRNGEIDAPAFAAHGDAAAGRYAVLEVADAGCGMPPEIVNRIFEPFYTTKALGQGTGLGLSTVLGIVRSHGGFVQVSSEVGRGSVFTVYLPAQTAAAPAALAAHPNPARPRGNGEVILLVEDDDAILKVTRQTLESFGYRVIAAADGAEAIKLYTQWRNEIALVLTDLMMPMMDGAVLIAALRRMDPKVKVIAASGFHAGGDLAGGLQPDTPHFLPKPYTAEALLTLIRQLVALPD